MPYADEMELAFGQSFSSVKAYTGRAGEMSALGAAAATDGDSVAFADANPSRGVVAHELAHVAQGRLGGGKGIATKSVVSEPSHASEREANRAADQVAGGTRPTVGEPLTSSINLLGDDEAADVTGKHLPPDKETNFRAFIIRKFGMSYQAAIKAMQTPEELQQAIQEFLATGGEAESWWGLGRRYASNALPQAGMGMLMGGLGALVTAPFTGGLSAAARRPSPRGRRRRRRLTSCPSRAPLRTTRRRPGAAWAPPSTMRSGHFASGSRTRAARRRRR